MPGGPSQLEAANRATLYPSACSRLRASTQAANTAGFSSHTSIHWTISSFTARFSGLQRGLREVNLARSLAASVFSVSTSDSPFETLEPEAVIDTASAPSRLAAISKLVRVRVDAS